MAGVQTSKTDPLGLVYQITKQLHHIKNNQIRALVIWYFIDQISAFLLGAKLPKQRPHIKNNQIRAVVIWYFIDQISEFFWQLSDNSN